MTGETIFYDITDTPEARREDFMIYLLHPMREKETLLYDIPGTPNARKGDYFIPDTPEARKEEFTIHHTMRKGDFTLRYT